MALSPGTRLGPYEVTAQIGVGGMGEVYRATDTNLKRQVAIKVLPASVAGDTERLARFQREAEVLAALNHPHIAAIYGLEKTPEFTALVMELVEGDDLSQLIARRAGPTGPAGLPLDEALPIAKQIAEALEAAHEQGIIHRDLKPANIKVRADGTVKVLDFGLAKALGPDSGQQAVGSGQGVALSQSPTITTPAMMTGVGMILGTAAYMSPEQARGKVVDKRADIWAFGAVLFEMLSGTRPFDGEDIAETLGAVIHKEPVWSRLPAATPASIRTVLERCLQKDPRQRLRDIGDVRLALDGAFETAAPQTPSVATSSGERGRVAWLVASVAVLVAAALAVPAVRYLREAPSPAPPETRVDIVTPATDRPADFALSPDGRQIVFVASGDGVSRLWVRSLATTTAQPLAGTEGAAAPFWSPDSQSIGFFAGGALKRLDLGGGVPQSLALVTRGLGGTWNADGVIVFAPGLAAALMRVAATGGAAMTMTTFGPGQTSHRYPQFLPDGRRFLFFSAGAADTAGIYLGTLDGDGPMRLTPADRSGVYLPSGPGRAEASSEGGARSAEASSEGGWLLWVRAGTLVAQRLDVAKAALMGEPVRLAEAVTAPTFNESALSVAATGLVAYRMGGASQSQLTWFDRSGTARGTLGDADTSLFQPNVSPDGRQVVVNRAVQGNTDVWRLDGGRTSRFTFDAANDVRPIWSPDGTRVAFGSNRMGQMDLYQRLTSGAGVEERFVASDQVKTASSWSADGRFLLFNSTDPQTSIDLWVAPMVGDRTPSVFLKTPFRETQGAFSPDGQWVAYQSNESGRDEVYVRPFVSPSPQASADKSGTSASAPATAGGQWQVSTEGGIHPVWRRDGKELYYLNPVGAMMAAPIATGATFSPGAPVVLFPTRIVGGGLDGGIGRQYDVAPDGRILINTALPGDAAPITLIQNWQPEAKK
ncbi:MAG: protein kinase [Vicinamibacterales bacterium]